MKSHRLPRCLRLAWIGLALALIPAAVLAASFTGISNPDPAAAESYWTPERLRDAQPTPVPKIDFDAFAAGPEESFAPLADGVSTEGRAPTAGVRPSPRKLFEPLEAPEEDLPGEIAEKASGSTGAYFTSARLVPVTADLSYPYSTIGRLYYTNPGHGDFYCSAAVIQARVVLAAAQCIHSGTASPGFFTNFRFVPAYRSGAAPFGTWTWNYVLVYTTWTTGGGRLPNAVDYGFLEMKDQAIGGVTRRVGDVVGWLGTQTLKLRPNHAHILGYASNFDSGERMHQVTAQSFRAASNNNVEYGSDMRGGSAGAPLIQDFGDNAALVKVIGVVSYTSTSTAVKTEGASIPDSRFTMMRTVVCAHRAGNCP